MQHTVLSMSGLMAKPFDNLRYCRDQVLVHATPFLLKHSSYKLLSSSELFVYSHWPAREDNTTRCRLGELQEAGSGDHTTTRWHEMRDDDGSEPDARNQRRCTRIKNRSTPPFLDILRLCFDACDHTCFTLHSFHHQDRPFNSRSTT